MTDRSIQRFRRRYMLTCRDVDEFLAAYLDQRLEGALRQRFERHLARCSNCVAYLDQYRETTRLVREAGEVPQDPPEELIESTLRFLREHTADDSDATGGHD